MEKSPPLLMTPGPVKIAKSVLHSIASHSLHHRDAEFTNILKALFKNLQYIFKTTEPVLILNSSGSGAMEAALVNSLSPNDEVLIIVAGKFGQRWADIALAYNIKVHIFEVKWGHSINLELLEKKINSLPKLSALCMQACETSTASNLPVKKISDLLQRSSPKSLLIVDAITALGAINIEQDAWKIDILIGGSQKALAGPAGLAFISFSKKAMKAYPLSQCPKYYWDIKPQLESYKKNQTTFSSAVHLILALKTATDPLQGPGLQVQIDKVYRLSQLSTQALNILQLKAFSSSPSPSLTAFYSPNNICPSEWIEEIRTKYNISLVGGQDQLKGKIIRIGHMGNISPSDLHKTFNALAESLYEKKQINKNQIQEIKQLFFY